MYQIYSDNTLIYDDSVPTIYSREDAPRSESVDFSQQTAKKCFINGSGIYKASSSSIYRSVFVEIPSWASSVTLVKSGSPSAYFTLLRNNTYSNNATPAYATGYDNRVQYTGARTVTIPSDAQYVWIYTFNGTSDITPSMQFNGIEYGTLVARNGAVNPKLTLTAGAAGSLELTLTPASAGYSEVQRLSSTIHVLRDGTEIWQGRALSESSDLWKDRNLMCEGAMAYLNDTIYLSGELTGPSASLVYAILSQHNSRVAPNRQIQMGVVDGAGTILDGDLTLGGDVRTSLDALNSLVSAYGGILRTRISAGAVYLDWLADYPSATAPQTIRFGENMLDFAPTQDCTDYATAVYVRGSEIQDSSGGTGVYYNSGWVSKDTGVVWRYGVIERYLEMSDLQSNADCVTEAVRWLNDKQYDELTLSIGALDLHALNPNVQPFNLLERVNVISEYHGMNKTFAVIGLSINLDDPAKTGFTLGDPVVAYKRRVRTLTEQTIQDAEEAHEEFEAANAYTEQKAEEAANALTEAREEINDTMNSLSQGYIFIDTDGTDTQGIYIVEHPIHALSEIQNGWNVWKWSADGFGHTNAWAGDQTVWNVAITHDGKINADMILVGKLLAQYIRLYGDMAVYNGPTGTVEGGYIGYGEGQTDATPTMGIHMYMDTGVYINEVIVTSVGARMSSKGYGGAHSGQANLYVAFDANTGAATVTVDGDLIVNGNITASGSITPNVNV